MSGKKGRKNETDKKIVLIHWTKKSLSFTCYFVRNLEAFQEPSVLEAQLCGALVVLTHLTSSLLLRCSDLSVVGCQEVLSRPVQPLREGLHFHWLGKVKTERLKVNNESK